MGIFEFILFPFYVALFYVIVKNHSKKYTDPVLKIYLLQGFWIKVVLVIPFVFFNSKISPGDSFVLFQVEGANIYKLILKDFDNIRFLFGAGKDYDQSGLLFNYYNAGYFSDENNYAVCRIVTLLSFFTFGKYLITCLFFSMLSFSGVWRLYRFFYELYPHLHKQLAIAILYLPTFVFWSSGILKDPICTGAMGWITYSLYEAIYKKKNITKNVITIVISGFILSAIKVYILVSYVPFLILFLILKNINLIKSTFLKVIIVICILVGVMVSFTKIMNQLRNSMMKFAGEDLTKTIKNYQENYASQTEAQSNFSLGVEFDGSLTSLIKMAPAAVVATLYRPFLWETRKPSTLLTSLESLAIFLLTFKIIRKAGLRNFFKSWRDPAVMYCLAFSLFFAIFVGATTPNFGTLCRYKIPCMPFYIIAMYLIEDLVKNKKQSPLKVKQAVL